MNLIVITLIVSIIGLAVCLRLANPQPVFMPLLAEPDDPLLKEATQRAQSSLDEFYKLYKEYPDHAMIKLRFVSNTDQVEHIWGEVLSQSENGELQVRLTTPPVTHRGHLERLQTCKKEEIEDWAVLDESSNIYGGYTERAMFEIAKRDGIDLPKKLLERKNQYREYQD